MANASLRADGHVGTTTPALVPVFTGTLNAQSVQLCDARTLHAFMQVKRDFTTWIKGRIRKFGFVEGMDFIAISRSPNRGSGNRGAATDYHLTLDMAKELSMVENNEQGREARRYFIACERQVLEALATAPGRPALDYARITPAQAQTLKELVQAVVDGGTQNHGETWARLHSKFRVNSYLALSAAQFEHACDYLRAKCAPVSHALPAPGRNRSPDHWGKPLPLPRVILEPARSLLDAAVWRMTGQAHDQIADWAARRLANACRVDVADDLQRRAEGALNALQLDDFLTCGEASRTAVLLSLVDAMAATATEQAQRLRQTLAGLSPQAGQGGAVNLLNRDS